MKRNYPLLLLLCCFLLAHQKAKADNEVVFLETFAGCNGTGGTDETFGGTAGSGDLVYDNEGWTADKCGGGSQCIKYGTSSAIATLSTPHISLKEGTTAILTFKAAGWKKNDTDNTKNTLTVSSEGCTVSGDISLNNAKTDKQLVNGEWTTYTVTISDITGPITIKFSGKRGFLDDVKSSRLCVGMRGLPLQTVKTYEGNICSTDSQSMVNIFHDILRLYPARSYGLVMCSHASGWLFDDPVTKAQDSRRRSFGIDNGKRTTANQGQKMNIPTLAGVLEGCTHFDYVMFDACFMQCIEVAYELRHTADYIIASPAEIPGTGAPFTKLMRLLAATPTDAATAAAIAERYASEALSSTYRGAELSVIRTDRLEHLAQTTAPIMQQLLANAKELNTYGVQHYYPDLWSTYYPAFYDMKHLLYTHLDSATYAQWDRVFEEAVPTQALTPSWYSAYNWGSQQYLIDQTHTGGVSIYLPRSTHKTLGWIDDYHRLQWYKDLGLEVTNW